jgi:hypothetical protein
MGVVDLEKTRQERDAARVKSFLREHPKIEPLQLFFTAYKYELGCFDRYEVQANYDRWKAAQIVPSYLTTFLTRFN